MLFPPALPRGCACHRLSEKNRQGHPLFQHSRFSFFGYVALIAAPLRIEGVIVNQKAILLLSPFDSAEQLGTLPEGELVTVEQTS